MADAFCASRLGSASAGGSGYEFGTLPDGMELMPVVTARGPRAARQLRRRQAVKGEVRWAEPVFGYRLDHSSASSTSHSAQGHGPRLHAAGIEAILDPDYYTPQPAPYCASAALGQGACGFSLRWRS